MHMINLMFSEIYEGKFIPRSKLIFFNAIFSYLGF